MTDQHCGPEESLSDSRQEGASPSGSAVFATIFLTAAIAFAVYEFWSVHSGLRGLHLELRALHEDLVGVNRQMKEMLP